MPRTTSPTTHIHKSSEPEPVTLETPTGSFEQYQRYLPIAQAIDAAEVRAARIDVGLVLANAARGASAVLARRAEVEKLATVSIDDILSLTSMGDALAYAAGIVDVYMPLVGDTRADVARARALRLKLLTKADVLVLDGIVPAETVRGIRKGQGLVDAANDLVQLARLFQLHASALPKSVVVDPIDVQTADSLGRKLLVTLRPARAKRLVAPELAAAQDARDRLWTLFEQTWERNVWRAGANLFLRDLDAHVPPLMSAVRSRRKPPTPTPQPTPAA